MLLETKQKIQKTHRCSYVLDYLEKKTDQKRLKSAVRYLKTYGNRVKTDISETYNKRSKPQLLPEEQIEGVTKVVLDKWQPYIAKYP